MSTRDRLPHNAANLRKQAEELARSRKAEQQLDLEAMTPEEVRQALHDLRVHQIELELQNDELRRAQGELDAERARYFDLYDMAPVGYCSLSEHGLILLANLTAASLLGVTRGKLTNQRFSQFILKDDQASYYLHHKQLIMVGEPQRYELRLVKADGTIFWARLETMAVPDADGETTCRVVISDISAAKQAEEELRLSEERLKLAMGGSNDGYWNYRLDNGESYFSPRYYTMLGYEPGEFVVNFESFSKLVHPDDLPSITEAIKTSLLASDTIDVEIRMSAKSGEWKWILSRSQVVDRDTSGKPTKLAGTHTDITRRKRDEELQHQIEHLIQHDLRAPAANAINMARILREKANLTEAQRLNVLDLFEQAGQDMLDTLTSSMDLYKIESGQYQPKPEALDCLAVLRKLIEILTMNVQFASINLEVLVSGKPLNVETRCPCVGELHLLRAALRNLLINALEASAPGESVVVELSSDKDCCIEITNKGVVPVEIRDNFFEKYVSSGKRTGTGLGTYSAQMMVKAQGGDITMRTSDVDNETTVTIRLPR